MDLLRVERVSKKIQGESVLKEISFIQYPSQNIAIAGETGSGKSTLLKIIAGLVQPDSGTVHFEGIHVKGPEERLIPGHPGIAYLSQDYELRHHYRVEEILEYANKLPVEEAEAIYTVCRIKHLIKRKSDQLSGGEKQRVAIARLLISLPKLLLLDEPYSNLDTGHKKILKAVIHDIKKQLGTSCLLVSHDPLDTLSWADEIIVLKAGEIIQHGTPVKIYNQPADEYTAGLFGSYTKIPIELSSNLSRWKVQIPKDKCLFLRPEQIMLSEEDDRGIKGKVKSIRYYGSHYELDIIVSELPFTLRTVKNGIKEGDEVFIALSTDRLWYL